MNKKNTPSVELQPTIPEPIIRKIKLEPFNEIEEDRFLNVKSEPRDDRVEICPESTEVQLSCTAIRKTIKRNSNFRPKNCNLTSVSLANLNDLLLKHLEKNNVKKLRN